MKKLRPLLPAFVVFLPLACLWFILINHLRVEWTLNPQYAYGWAVPMLCVFLIGRNCSRTDSRNGGDLSAATSTFKNGRLFPAALLCLLALLYAPTRLVQEANPDWRFISWTLAVEVIGITLCVLRLALRSSTFPLSNFRFSAFVFPICFFLVAVPWPTTVEHTLIQGLTRADARVATECLGWLGVPAMPHGNVIEVATGEVGIDEACSGIRSFQATLMIALFLGEFYRLNGSRRLLLVLGGIALSFGFNLVRMSLLVGIAAHQGIAAIATWHDPAGVTILVACFFGLWGLGAWLGQKRKLKNVSKSGIPSNRGPAETKSAKGFQSSAFGFCLALACWILAVEISVEWWYRSHEARLPAAQPWTVVWPAPQPAFQTLPIPAAARQILRYDEGRSASWQEDNRQWQAIFLRWNPGSAAQHLAQNHTPEVCLTAAGHTLTPVPGLRWFEVAGLHLPFRIYQVTDTPRPCFVAYCLWDDRARAQGFATASLGWGNRLAPVRTGSRNPGQRSLEIAVTGVADESQAEAALENQLPKIIQRTPGQPLAGDSLAGD